MEKLYTQKEYQLQAEKANKDGLFLYQLVREQEYAIEVLEYEKKIVSQDIYSEDGEIIGSQEVEVDDLTKPIMVEEEITNPETGRRRFSHSFVYANPYIPFGGHPKYEFDGF